MIVTDDNPRTEDPAAIRSAILKACDSAVECPSRQSYHRRPRIDAGDVLLIAGEGHETSQLIGNETLPFDDASVASNQVRAVHRKPLRRQLWTCDDLVTACGGVLFDPNIPVRPYLASKSIAAIAAMMICSLRLPAPSRTVMIFRQCRQCQSGMPC